MPEAGLSERERQALRSGAALVGAVVDAAFEVRLATYLRVLEIWGRRVSLVSAADRLTVIRKHVVDSLAVVPLLPAAGMVVDVGSGAGFPGLVLALLRPDLEVVLVECRRRKASFLSDAVRRTGVDRVRVLNERVESVADAPAGMAALVVARALRLQDFLPAAARLVSSHGMVVAMQTPARLEAAEAVASDASLSFERSQNYALSGGESRSLFLFRRR